MVDVDHPKHYNIHPSGVECIEIVEYMNFNTGSAMKYIWRAGIKSDYVEDLEKAIWCLRREISRFKKHQNKPLTNDDNEGT